MTYISIRDFIVRNPLHTVHWRCRCISAADVSEVVEGRLTYPKENIWCRCISESVQNRVGVLRPVMGEK